MTGILTLTLNPALDVSTSAPKVVANLKLRCTPPVREPGGGGVNVSRAIVYLGGKSLLAVAAGGATGDELLALLAVEGFTAERLPVNHMTRESLSVTDDATGGQYRFVMPGPSWSASDCAAVTARMVQLAGPGDLVVPSGSLPPGVPADYPVALSQALAEKGARVLLDTSGAALKAAASTGSGLFALRMDHAEAEGLADKALTKLEEIADFAAQLIEARAAELVQIAAGPRGTIVATRDGRWHCRPPVVKEVSKVGAGDSFVGGFALALSEGRSPLDATAYGVAAAAAAVTTPGTRLCEKAMTDQCYGKVLTQTI